MLPLSDLPASACEACNARPPVVEVEWPSHLGIAVCVPCAHRFAKRGMVLSEPTSNTLDFVKPIRWKWATTVVA
jgi:hypothetical protein